MNNELIRHKFRRSALGGFKRKDVAAYIESASAQHNQQVKQLEEENKSLSARNDELSGMLLEMEQRLKTARASLDAAVKEKDQLAAVLEELTLQTEQTEEAESVKEAEPVEAPEIEEPEHSPVSVPVIKAPKSSVRTLLDSIRPEVEESPNVEVADGDGGTEVVVESPNGKELLASIKIYYPR